MAVDQEEAYERPYRWVQEECGRLGDIDNPEVSVTSANSVCCLKERPILFRYCVEEVAVMHNALFRRFISALTHGGPSGLPKPIEVHAHDPLRYVGDMLGWLHHLLEGNISFVFCLIGILKLNYLTRNFIVALLSSSENDVVNSESDSTFVLDRIFEGVCRVLKVRVELNAIPPPPPPLLFWLCMTAAILYISDLLGRQTALCNTLWVLKEAAQKTFFEILKTRGQKLLRYPLPVAVDPSPLTALMEGVSLLCEIIETHNSMMFPASGKKPDFHPVISALLDPIIQMCEQAAEAHKSKEALRLSSRQVLILANCKDHLQMLFWIVAAPFLCPRLLKHLRRFFSSTVYVQSCWVKCKGLANIVTRIGFKSQTLCELRSAFERVRIVGKMMESHMMNGLVEKGVDGILKRCGLLSKTTHFCVSLDDDEAGKTVNGSE
ncbi:unnamed protein product [Coffea canephora]|uniref:Conserved Oligomeric Golgi complex subunit 6 C-terminal domain-containing protein n=1 Tax=Coffea canephora TaxID=49390 RepID=A0A068UJF5_COFCA|nr:unnamed protein product [Coffea canephora]